MQALSDVVGPEKAPADQHTSRPGENTKANFVTFLIWYGSHQAPPDQQTSRPVRSKLARGNNC